MYKEIIIIIVVITLIVGIDIITNNYTNDTVMIMKEELKILKEYILEKNKEKSNLQMESIKSKWDERYEILAFYIEHDELEKVKTQLAGLSANLNVEEYNLCIEKIDTTVFILEHIQEKEEFHLRSIF